MTNKWKVRNLGLLALVKGGGVPDWLEAFLRVETRRHPKSYTEKALEKKGKNSPRSPSKPKS